MGAHLCSFRRSRREEQKEFSNVSHSSFAELLRSESPSGERKKNKRAMSSTDLADQVVGKVRKLTLEEWLISSPARPKSENGMVESRRVFPASPLVHHAEGTDLDSGKGGESSMDIGLLSENGSHTPAIGKAKKRVSFKLPQEADIIIFYSPARDLQEILALLS